MSFMLDMLDMIDPSASVSSRQCLRDTMLKLSDWDGGAGNSAGCRDSDTSLGGREFASLLGSLWQDCDSNDKLVKGILDTHAEHLTRQKSRGTV